MSKLKLKKNKKMKLIGIIVVLLLVAGGIGYYFLTKNGDGNNNSADNSKKGKGKKKSDEPQVKIVDLDSKTRPFAVMINNLGVARKYQCGLQDAYIIYEIIVEGGITRYMALFKDTNTDCIGTIRSSRHYYLDYALENDAIYVHHGQSPQAQADFGNLGIDRVVASEPNTGWREKNDGVSSEHTLYSSIEKIKKGLGKKRTESDDKHDWKLLNYSVKPLDLASIPNSQVANNVFIQYSKSFKDKYVYDAENKVYKRYVNDVEHKDKKTQQQYTFKNIITYQVRNVNLNDGENKGRQDLKNIGEGTGYYISEGYAIPIKWKKDSRESKTKYTLEDGSELKVNDGNTFIQIQPVGEPLTISE